MRQPTPLDEKEGDQEPSQSTIPIQKRVNCFKLFVHDGALNEIGECIPVVEELFPISQQIVQIFR